MGSKMGRPMTREFDFDLLQKMLNKGFTNYECAEYFNIPLITIQYYAKTRNMGKFSRYKKGFYDDEILKLMDTCKNQTEVAEKLGISQSHVSRRYNRLKEFEKKKVERYKWLKKQKRDSAKDVVKN